MGASFVIALREGIEAALIVSIILAYLKQLGATDRSTLVWWGTLVAVAVSAIAGTAIFAAGAEFEGATEEVFEGIVTLAAVGVLTWMIFWMRRQGARIRSELHEKVDTALVAGGLALAIVLGVLLYRGGIRMNLRSFFRITGWILIVVAAGLVAYSLHELQEAGWIPILEAHAFDISASLPDDEGVGAIVRGLIGYNADPTWLEVVGWAGYLVIVGALYMRAPVVPGSKSRPEHETSAMTSTVVESDRNR